MEPQDPVDEPDGPVDDGDALDHLWSAAHEMLRAMRSVLDAADEFVASQREARPAARDADEPRSHREGRVHHIDIDLRADDDSRPGADTTDAGAR